jgi:hypothetical protein
MQHRQQELKQEVQQGQRELRHEMQEGQQQLVAIFESLASKLEGRKEDPPQEKGPPSLSNAVHGFATPKTPLYQPTAFPPPPGFPA